MLHGAQHWEKGKRDELDRSQRRATKIVLRTTDSDAEKKWLPLHMRRDMLTIDLTFKCFKGSPPMFFKDYFRFLEQFKTRGEVDRTYCSPKLELKLKGSLFILMIKTLKKFPREFKDLNSVVIFKCRILELY